MHVQSLVSVSSNAKPSRFGNRSHEFHPLAISFVTDACRCSDTLRVWWVGYGYLMRILHTSDWHLGRTLHGVDLLADQAAYLEHLTQVVQSERVDAVLVSGDVYDRAIPPVDAVELLSSALARLAEHTRVILTPGNHDSATRLGFGAALMTGKVSVRAKIAQVGQPVEFQSDSGERALIYALPFLDPDAARSELSGPDAPLARSHEAVMGAAMGRVRADLTARGGERPAAIVMAHAFVVGGEPSESERDIKIGGVDSVPAGLFKDLDYAALGHLHGPQSVGQSQGVVARYSGSPLAYSFSEMNHKKSTVLLDVGQGGLTKDPELIAAPRSRKLSEVSGRLEDLLGAKGEPFVDDWLRVFVTDPQRPQEMNSRLKARFPHALVLQHRPAEGAARARESITVTPASNPVEVGASFVAEVTGHPATKSEQDVLVQAFDRAKRTERSN